MHYGWCLDNRGCNAQARSRRSVAGKDIMLDPRAGIRKAGAMPPLMALLKEVVEVGQAVLTTCLHGLSSHAAGLFGQIPHVRMPFDPCRKLP